MNIWGYIFFGLLWFVIANRTYKQLRLQMKEFGGQVGVYVPDWLLNIASFIPLVWPIVAFDYLVRKSKQKSTKKGELQ